MLQGDASEPPRAAKERSSVQLPEDLVKGRYVLGEIIGIGANSCVIRGTDVVNQTTVAIKRMVYDSTRDQIEEWLKEIQMLKSLDHKNVVRYIDHAQTAQYLYIVMEYAEKRSLQSAISSHGRMAESDCIQIIHGLVKALNYLHSLGIVHRDVKAGNILLDASGNAVLTDFGLALKQSSDVKDSNAESAEGGISPEATKELVGSVYWMAPELVSNAQPATTAADIWAVGCVLIEMLTKKPPFFDRTPYNALYTLAQDLEPPIPVDCTISPSLRQFLGMCFQRDPTKRATAEQLLSSEWLSRNCPPASPVAAQPKALLDPHRKEPASMTAAWVSKCMLFPSQRDEWLRRGGLDPVVAALLDIEPAEAKGIVSILADAANTLSGEHTELFVAIARTPLWHQLLALKGPSGPSMGDVCTLFSTCCANQRLSAAAPPGQLAATQGGIIAELLLDEATCVPTMKALESVLTAPSDATAPPPQKPLAVWMLESGVLQSVAKAVESTCGVLLDQAGWEWIDSGCACILILSEPDVALLTQTFTDDMLAVVTDASQSQCPSAVRLLLRLARVNTEYVVQNINVQIFLQCASDTELPYSVRSEVAQCFPMLQATEAGRATFADTSLSVPLLGHILNSAPPHGCADAITPVFIELCNRDEQFAAACSDNHTVFRTVLNKLCTARVSSRPLELENVLVLLRVIFCQAVRPDVFVKSNELTASLAKTLQERHWPESVHREAAALLDAFSAITRLV